MIQVQAIFLLALITISWGGLVNEDESATTPQNESDLQKILEKFYEQGKLNRVVQKHIKKHDDEHHKHHDKPSTTNIQTFNVYYKKRSDDSSLSESDRMCKKCKGNECKACVTRSGDDVIVDEIAEMLDELEGEIELESVTEINGQANKCKGDFICLQVGSSGKNEDRDNHLRCGCSHRKEDEDDNIEKDNLQCTGNRCGRGRDDKDEEERDGDLRCRGNRCVGNRDESEETRYDQRDMHDLRCIGNRCGGSDRNDRDDLRCRGNRCGRGRSGKKLRPEIVAENNMGSHVTVYKIGDNLDALVLDMPDLDNLVKDIVRSKTDESRYMKVIENIDLKSLIGKLSNEKGDVDAIVIDLSKMKNGDLLAKQIENVMVSSNNELSNVKEIESSDSNREMNLASKLFTENQKRLLEVQRLGSSNVRPSDSMIMAHEENNNNVFVPKWLHDFALLKEKLRRKEVMESVAEPVVVEKETKTPKSLFPLTQKQKSRIQMKQLMNERLQPRSHWRREEDVGFPFELQVQGLGQVNP